MWLLMMQISLLSDLRLFVSKNDFLQEGVVRFQWNLGVTWYYGLAVHNVKFSPAPKN